MELDPNEHALHNAPFLWRTPEPKKSYEAVIVGGGLHGLATAYYLAKNHGMKDVAVVVSPWFLLLTAFVGLNQLMYVAFGTCGAALILTRVFHLQKGCAR